MCKRRVGPWCLVLLLVCGLASAAVAQASPQAVSGPGNAPAQLAHVVPVMDGGAGPCSVQFRVTTADGKPVYAAIIKVHIAYGFGGFHKLDLQASTNVDGKADFTGLPVRVRRPPLAFEATDGRLSGTATYDPESECQAKHDIMLAAQPSSN